MSLIRVFKIYLGNPHRIYQAGQKIHGFIIVDNYSTNTKGKTAKRIQEINVRLIGRAKTHWREGCGRGDSRIVGDIEYYINKKIVLYGTESRGKEKDLQPGCHQFSFTFQLPINLPSSCNYKYGGVKYILDAFIHRQGKSPYSTSVSIVVKGNLNLNDIPDALFVVQKSGRTSSNGWFCCTNSGSVGFYCKIPQSGFICNEPIPFLSQLQNYTRKTIRHISLALVQELKFYAKSSILRLKSKSVTILTLQGPTLEPGASKTWRPERLIIPDIPPTQLGGCSIIDVRYFLKVSESLKTKVSIVVGTVPIRPLYNHLNNQNQIIRNEHRLPIMPSLTSPAANKNYRNGPPPYDEVVQIPPPLEQITQNSKSHASGSPPKYEEVMRLQNLNMEQSGNSKKETF